MYGGLSGGVSCRGADEPRPRRPQLLDPCPQLRGEALVLEREGCGSARRADQLRLVGERGVVLDRRDPAALQLDLGPAAPRQRDRAPRGVDEPARLGQPVRDRDGGVAERLGNMKGALMKVGQMASYLDDGLPEPVRQALAALQAAAPPMSGDLAAEVVEFAKERVAAYKYPRRVVLVDALPKGPTGKILKREISV